MRRPLISPLSRFSPNLQKQSQINRQTSLSQYYPPRYRPTQSIHMKRPQIVQNKHYITRPSQYVRPYYHQNMYYPFSTFYWYNYDIYSPYFNSYYHYYLTHGFPRVNYYGPLVLFSGRRFWLSPNFHTSALNQLSLKLRQCQNGPEYYFTVRVRGKIFRVFLGDVNDYFNVQCLYMMNAVISIGDVDYAQRVYEIFHKPSKTLSIHGKTIQINPFENAKYVPGNVHMEQISHHMKEVSFDVQNLSLPTKKIIFYHRKHLGVGFNYEDIFREIGPEVPSGNVLFVIDQFQRQSVQAFGHYLTRFRHYTPHRLYRIRYKNYYVFPRQRQVAFPTRRRRIIFPRHK